MPIFNILISLGALVLYVRSGAVPMFRMTLHQWPAGLRPTLAARVSLAAAVIGVAAFGLDVLYLVLTRAEPPIWALIVRIAGLWIAFLLPMAGMRFPLVRLDDAVRDAILVADGHIGDALANPDECEQHLRAAVEAWERAAELAPAHFEIQYCLSDALYGLASADPAHADELYARAERHRQRAYALRSEEVAWRKRYIGDDADPPPELPAWHGVAAEPPAA